MSCQQSSLEPAVVFIYLAVSLEDVCKFQLAISSPLLVWSFCFSTKYVFKYSDITYEDSLLVLPYVSLNYTSKVFKNDENCGDFGDWNESFPTRVCIDFLCFYAEFLERFFLDIILSSDYKIYWKGIAIVYFCFSHFLIKEDVVSDFWLLSYLGQDDRSALEVLGELISQDVKGRFVKTPI